MSGFVWLAFVVGMIIYSQAQAKKMKEKQRAKTAFERLDELVEEAARTHHPKAEPAPKSPTRTANRKAGSSTIRKQQPQEETRRQIAERKQELKRKRAQQTASVEPAPHAIAQEAAPKTAATPAAGEEFRNEFDLRRAVIYSEILKPRYEAYE